MRKVTLLAAGLVAAAGLVVPATAANAANDASTTVNFSILGTEGGGCPSLSPVGSALSRLRR